MSTVPITPTTAEFSTDNIYLAIWLIAAQKLTYIGVRFVLKNGQAYFAFADPEGKGLALESEYVSSDPLIPIKKVQLLLQLLRDHIRRGHLQRGCSTTAIGGGVQ